MTLKHGGWGGRRQTHVELQLGARVLGAETLHGRTPGVQRRPAWYIECGGTAC